MNTLIATKYEQVYSVHPTCEDWYLSLSQRKLQHCWSVTPKAHSCGIGWGQINSRSASYARVFNMQQCNAIHLLCIADLQALATRMLQYAQLDITTGQKIHMHLSPYDWPMPDHQKIVHPGRTAAFGKNALQLPSNIGFGIKSMHTRLALSGFTSGEGCSEHWIQETMPSRNYHLRIANYKTYTSCFRARFVFPSHIKQVAVLGLLFVSCCC